MSESATIPIWVGFLMILPFFITSILWARLVFQNMAEVGKLRRAGVLPAFLNPFHYLSGKYDQRSPVLKEIRSKFRRLLGLVFLSIVWALGVWLIAGAIIRS